ncbi:unnamed protein product [Malus baccata var. baccata]
MSRLITCRRSATNMPPALSTSIAPGMSAPLIGEPTPLTEATPTTSQVPVSSTSSVSVQPLSARQPHWSRRELEPSDHTSSASKVKGEDSQPRFSPFKYFWPTKKNTRGPIRMLKPAQSIRLTASKIKIAYDLRHRGVATSQQHSRVVSSCGVVIRQCCPMQWESWAKIPEKTKKLVQHKLSVRDLIQAIHMSCLQISLPTPDLAPPSTFESLRPANT